MKTEIKTALKTVKEVSYNPELSDTERLGRIREYCDDILEEVEKSKNQKSENPKNN